ncbi:MAG: hypothetical protein QM734_03250 [Cyclobacteriaceae bacterium]
MFTSKRIFISALLLLSFNLIHAQEIDNAGSYLEYVGNQFEEISKDMMSYTSAASHGKSARKVEKRRKELLQTVKDAEINMRKLKPYRGDRALRDSVISYFHINGLVLNQEYAKIVDMEEVAEQSYDMMEAYLLAKEKANQKLDDAYEKVSNQQKIFADKNKIRLVETSSKLSQKVAISNKVFQYYNQIYLIFFKSYKDEIYLMDAVKKSDVSAIEQTKNSLDKNATEGMKQLMKFNAFEGDPSLKNACMKALEFYKSEALKSPGLVDFLLKEDKYEKTKKAFDAKRESDRTQADIDSYNKGVNEFNAAVNNYNALNNDLQKNRSTIINNWNKSADNFLDNHIPKYR